MLLPFEPVAIILVASRFPSVDAFALDAALRIQTLVSISISEFFETCSVPLIEHPGTLIVTTITVCDYAETRALIALWINFAEVN